MLGLLPWERLPNWLLGLVFILWGGTLVIYHPEISSLGRVSAAGIGLVGIILVMIAISNARKKPQGSIPYNEWWVRCDSEKQFPMWLYGLFLVSLGMEGADLSASLFDRILGAGEVLAGVILLPIGIVRAKKRRDELHRETNGMDAKP